ncbi:hypothetical protein BDR06DRAFT_1025728 [Suillus hirtellus]|nr:hypothetical protein BDR06DRAFT_1025728 [Suillus hirtellus]
MNPSSSSTVSFYNPPPAGSTPAIISLPAPSQTGHSGLSGGSTGASSMMYPTSNVGASSSSSKNNTTAIALGNTFGMIGLIAGGLAAVWYIKRSRGRGRFLILGGDRPVTTSTLHSSAPIIAPRRRHSSILDSYSPPSNPTHRSDSRT